MTTKERPGLRILILEDDPRDAELEAQALRRADPAWAVQVVDSRGTFTNALDSFAPDVVLSDSDVAGFRALDALRLLQCNLPSSPLLLVSGTLEQTGTECLKAGAADYVPMTDLARLGCAIRLALEVRAPLRRLSARQSAVFQRLASGQSTKEIASHLRISVKTIETHRAQVMSRLDIHDLAGLVRYAIRVGVVSPDDFVSIASKPRRGGAFAVHPPSLEALPDRIVREGEVAPARGSETIFLVEDEAAVRVAARRILERFGYHVIEAPGAEEALALAVKHREPVHLLLTDIVMPRMNGRELAKVFTRLHSEARVVLMSGYTDDEALRRDVSQAKTWYLQKPFSPHVLGRKVREVLDAPRELARARA